MDLVEEFYMDENPEGEQAQPESQIKTKSKINQGYGFVQELRKVYKGV